MEQENSNITERWWKNEKWKPSCNKNSSRKDMIVNHHLSNPRSLCKTMVAWIRLENCGASANFIIMQYCYIVYCLSCFVRISLKVWLGWLCKRCASGQLETRSSQDIRPFVVSLGRYSNQAWIFMCAFSGLPPWRLLWDVSGGKDFWPHDGPTIWQPFSLPGLGASFHGLRRISCRGLHRFATTSQPNHNLIKLVGWLCRGLSPSLPSPPPQKKNRKLSSLLAPAVPQVFH